jgi:sarcosine oxidase
MRVIVVGAGIVGLSTAWALRRGGHEAVVLDPGPIPNPLAASHDRHRLIRLAHGEGDGRGVIIHEAYAAWDRLWADLGRSHYRETGMLLTAREPTDWAVSCRAAFDRGGTPYEIWDRAELARRCPYLRLTERDWGLYTARGGALLADRILHDLAAWLRTRGVALRPGTQAVAVDPERATVHLADGERLEGDGAVVATGAWTARLLLDLAPVLEPRRTMVAYLEPPPDLAAAWASAPCFLDLGGPDDLYLVPPLDDLPALKFGAGSTSYPEDPDSQRGLRPDEPERLLRTLRPYLHDLDRYRVAECRICMYCFSPDERFVAGTLPGGRVAYATGCSGQMFKFGAIMGERLAATATRAICGTALLRWAVGEVAEAV